MNAISLHIDRESKRLSQFINLEFPQAKIKFTGFFSLLLYWILKIPLFRNNFELWYIGLQQKLITMLIGYGKCISNFTPEHAAKEYREIEKWLPIYQKIHTNIKTLTPESENEGIIFENFDIIVDEMESIEATLEILSNPNMMANIQEAENDIKSGNFDMFIEWNQKSIR